MSRARAAGRNAARYERVHLNAGVGYVIKKPQNAREIAVPSGFRSVYDEIKNMVESIVLSSRARDDKNSCDRENSLSPFAKNFRGGLLARFSAITVNFP